MTTSRSSNGPIDRVSITAGVVAGAGAFVAGYVLTYLLVTLDGEIELENAFEEVGMVFYNAHFVDMEESTDGWFFEGSSTSNAVLDGATGLPEAAYLLVPVVVLVLAGFAAVRWGPRASRPHHGAIAGATVVLGVLPLAFVGSNLFQLSASGWGVEETISVDPAMSILLVGIVYPLVFGGLGGLLASLVE